MAVSQREGARRRRPPPEQHANQNIAASAATRETESSRQSGENQDKGEHQNSQRNTETAAQQTAPKNGAALIHMLALLAAGLVTRLWNLEHPAAIVFDEIHFGKFASLYLQGRYFFDVHPPLGKLLLAAAGWAAGMNATFEFDAIGQAYDSTVPITALRLVPALAGAALAPLLYVLVTSLGFSTTAGLLSRALAVADTALLTQSRLVLLDTLLIACMLASVAAYTSARCHTPLSWPWWLRVLLSGLALGAALSIKLVSLSTVALLAACVARDLWLQLGNRDIPLKRITTTALALLAALAVLPLVVYIGTYAIHFAVLVRSGPGDAFMSPAFQATLEGSTFAQAPAAAVHAAFGARMTLRHVYGSRCWLHSHAHRYPVRPSGDENGLISSVQQQVTCYPFADPNNEWELLDAANVTLAPGQARLVQHGDRVRLRHVATGKTLNSHDVAGPLTPTAQEVSCYGPGDERAPAGSAGHMPAQDVWEIQVLGSTSPPVHVATTQLRLVHPTRTALAVSGKVLPEWGFGQFEVVAQRLLDDAAVVWQIDTHSHVLALPPATRAEHTPMSFWQKLWELHVEMIRANSRLTGEHTYGSRPAAWPLLDRGISYWHAPAKQGHQFAQIYLIGNPVVWWLSFAAIGVSLVLILFYAIREKRAIQDLDPATRARLLDGATVLGGGWALHYLPFFLFDRQLFLHHYLPALVFAIAILAAVLDHVCGRVVSGAALVVVLAAAAMAVFLAPFSLGTVLAAEQIEARRVRPGWNMAVP
eukprot:m.208730 g.208730  ORF g.208730 m.208730 type:complete len:762 (+) comp15549_c0_seq1:188-2473(+)